MVEFRIGAHAPITNKTTTIKLIFLLRMGQYGMLGECVHISMLILLHLASILLMLSCISASSSQSKCYTNVSKVVRCLFCQ